VRVLLGAFGDPGHAFPILALGRGLRARGHEVVVQTWRRWRVDAEREGLGFAAAPELDDEARVLLEPAATVHYTIGDTDVV